LRQPSCQNGIDDTLAWRQRRRLRRKKQARAHRVPLTI
jgi:hypothetical protein